MTTAVQPPHADTALLCQDACNPAGVCHALWRVLAETQHEHGPAATRDYAPARLMLFKLADMLGVPTEYGDAWNHAYLACRDNATRDD